jgi:hypothetical protein
MPDSRQNVFDEAIKVINFTVLTHEYITKWTAHKAVLAMDAKHCVFLL